MNEHPAFTDEQCEPSDLDGIVAGGELRPLSELPYFDVLYDGKKVELLIYHIDLDTGRISFHELDSEGHIKPAPCNTETAKLCRAVGDPSKLAVREIPGTLADRKQVKR